MQMPTMSLTLTATRDRKFQAALMAAHPHYYTGPPLPQRVKAVKPDPLPSPKPTMNALDALPDPADFPDVVSATAKEIPESWDSDNSNQMQAWHHTREIFKATCNAFDVEPRDVLTQSRRRDLVRAYLWFSLAARQGDPIAADMVASLSRRMTPEQIAQAKALARDWTGN